MTKAVLLGGNGYLGRNVTDHWLKADPQVEFYVVSRSGKNQLQDPRIHNLTADVTDYDAVAKLIPTDVDYIVDFVGAPEKDPEKFKRLNDQPATVMLHLAQSHHVKKMGFIAGSLGPKTFIKGKQQIIKKLQQGGISLAVVSPTLVYGNGRRDDMTRWVPLLKVLGIFNKKFRPVDVNDVANDLIKQLQKG
nr:NAD-dependent epimerase/dehydratase family protein [Limosilactobacillus mucosae]